MIKLGLTGGIGSGKSLATSVLKGLGAYIIDCDVIAREVTQPNASGFALLTASFGEGIVKDGALDRKALRDIAFSSPYKYALLNSLLLPLIVGEAKRRLCFAYGEQVAVVVAPILFEADMRPLFDIVWTIEAQENVRIERVLERDNMDINTIKTILGYQLLDSERRLRATLVLENNGTKEQFVRLVERSYMDLLKSNHPQ